jgi:hypothetical protein
MDARSDDDLLAASRVEPEAFAVFYRRHVTPLLAYFLVRIAWRARRRPDRRDVRRGARRRPPLPGR